MIACMEVPRPRCKIFITTNMDGFAGDDTFKVQLNTFLVGNKQD